MQGQERRLVDVEWLQYFFHLEKVRYLARLGHLLLLVVHFREPFGKLVLSPQGFFEDSADPLSHRVELI